MSQDGPEAQTVFGTNRGTPQSLRVWVGSWPFYLKKLSTPNGPPCHTPTPAGVWGGTCSGSWEGGRWGGKRWFGPLQEPARDPCQNDFPTSTPCLASCCLKSVLWSRAHACFCLCSLPLLCHLTRASWLPRMESRVVVSL